MQSKAKTIPEYLATLKPAEREVIARIDAMVRAAFPEVQGTMMYGMPTYELAGRMFAFNAQKNYFSLYVVPEIVQRHRAGLKGLDVGKSCIRFSSASKMPVDVLGQILSDYRKA